VKHAVMKLSKGGSLDVKAENLSDANVYVQSLTVNGKPWNSVYLPHAEIAKGGTLVFTMGPRPNKNWGLEGTLH
jgi:putative alpha-1,2-mannosidase